MSKRDDFSERRARLSAAKQALLEKHLRGKFKKKTDVQIIPRRSEDGLCPLSFAQQRLWFFNQLEPGSAVYNLFWATRLTGSLNAAALEQSINEIARRHASLRTTFSTAEDGQPVQIIIPTRHITLPIIDLQDISASEQETQVHRLAFEESEKSFDLSQYPLFRATLLKLSEKEHIILSTVHHIIADDWSMGVFMWELVTLYKAFSQGKPSPLPEPALQYTDFAQWQRDWFQGQVREQHLSYWKQQFSGSLPVLELPTDRPRAVTQTFKGKTHRFILSGKLSEQIRSLSQQEGCTLFMTLLTVFNILLYRYTGQEAIIVGSPFANRNRTQIEYLIGFFVNTIALRTDLSENPSFRELLRRVKETTLGAQAHQDVPFEQIVAEIHPEREANRQVLFQVMFAFQNAQDRGLELPGLMLTPLEIHPEISMFDMTFEIYDTEAGFSGLAEYNTDLFDPSTIIRMINHFETLLEGIIAHPEQRLSELPLLSETEWHQILMEWNETRTDYPKEKCIHELFEEQAALTPDAVAVVFEKQQLTYQELNQRANQLAHYLQKLGVKPETLVGICIERSLEMIVGIFGILKAGGAYIPIDPAYPHERLNFILKDTQTPVLLTQQHLHEKFSGNGIPSEERIGVNFPSWEGSGVGLRTVCLDTEWNTVEQENNKNPVNNVLSKNLMYVIYTSGSTGIPKGVLISHQALVNRSIATVKRYTLQPDERVLQFASISFDVSLEEIFPSLISGATIILRPYEIAISFNDLLAFLEQEKITVANLPTSYWHEWVAELSRSKTNLPSALRLVIVGTEQALSERLTQWQTLVGDRIRWINGYGPTEATITATMYEPEQSQTVTSIPIGSPLENTQVYLLDNYLQPVPVGVGGELYIGGDSLARGYLERPELTAEKFVPNPFNNMPGSRLYRTGDLARFLPDGNIEFLGRVDHQVKIRGFRVELGEIEAMLRQHPAVHETVVTVREDSPGNKRLIAYVLFDWEHTATINELRDFLKTRLPEYMLPALFVVLEEFPFTASGKIDRRALPDPEADRTTLGADTYVAPRTPTEKVLADIWAEILRLKQVGIHDNFFELGGDSILSIQIIARANQAGLKFTPRQLFQYQTISELAGAAAETSEKVFAEQNMITGLVPLTPIQHWFFEQELPEPHHWNQSILLKVEQELHPELLEQALHHLLMQHDALRLRFTKRESGNWQQECSAFHETSLISQIDVSDLSETDQKNRLEEEFTKLQRSLNISEGPVLRVGLVKRGAMKPNYLFLVIHHLVVDGVSWRILLEDLQIAYHNLQEGKQVQLPLKTTSFKHWAEGLTEYAKSTTLQEEIPYWTDESRNQILRLPRDYPEGVNSEASAQIVSYSLNAVETLQLLKEVPQAYNTRINDLLLTALTRSVAMWIGGQFVLIELEGHGREQLFEDVDLSRTAGWFTTTFPVLLDAGEVFSPGEALKSIKEQLRQIPNRGIGYGILRYLNQDSTTPSTLRALPKPEISFNYLGQFDQILSDSALFTFAEEERGQEHSPLGKRSHLLDINGFVIADKLELHWTYSENIYQRATIEHIAQDFMNVLRSLINHCLSPEAGGYTPSDFPDVELNQDDIDQILTEVSLDDMED